MKNQFNTDLIIITTLSEYLQLAITTTTAISRQFHQRFSRAFFVRMLFWQRFFTYIRTYIRRKKAAETTFVQKKRTKNVDEIDTSSLPKFYILICLRAGLTRKTIKRAGNKSDIFMSPTSKFTTLDEFFMAGVGIGGVEGSISPICLRKAFTCKNPKSVFLGFWDLRAQKLLLKRF